MRVTCEYLRVPRTRGRARRYRTEVKQHKDIEPLQPKQSDKTIELDLTTSPLNVSLSANGGTSSDSDVLQSRIRVAPSQDRPNCINTLSCQHNISSATEYGIRNGNRSHEDLVSISSQQHCLTPCDNPSRTDFISAIMPSYQELLSLQDAMDFSTERTQASSSSIMDYRFLEPSVQEHFLPPPQDKAVWSGGEFWYPVLNPLIEHIRYIISLSDACKLLEYYFTEPTDSTVLTHPHSPYVLAQIFRKKSFLRFGTYRPTSPALLCSMLLIALQTSNLEGLKVTLSSKGTSSGKLQDLCLRLLGPFCPEVAGEISIPGLLGNGDLDTVITYLHMATIISAGDSKGKSVKWWRAAVYLAISLGLNRELDSKYTDRPSPNGTEENKEERRRTWWLLYICDRHIALCYNLPLLIPQTISDSLYLPLDEKTWQSDDFVFSANTPRKYGPCYKMTGITLFGFFLPLMRILGETINLHHRRNDLSLDLVTEEVMMGSILEMLSIFEQSLQDTARNLSNHPSVITQIVLAYSSHLMHVLYVLVYGKWDPVLMIDDSDSWIGSPRFAASAEHTIAAMEAVSKILFLDPSLDYMPYLWGIYLLHGSFLLILFVEKMEQSCITNEIISACMTSLRAHEVIVTTLNTEYQV